MIAISEERQEQLLRGELGRKVPLTFANWEAFNAGFTAGIDAAIKEVNLKPPFEVSDALKYRLNTESWELKWRQCQGTSLESIYRIAFPAHLSAL